MTTKPTYNPENLPHTSLIDGGGDDGDMKVLLHTVRHNSDRITKLEAGQDSQNQQLLSIKEQLKAQTEEVRRGNEFLQSQNQTILNSILESNKSAEERAYNLRSQQAQIKSELWLKALGAGGVGYLVIELISNLINK